MEKTERKAHWDHIYGSKALTELSWYQEKPSTSLAFLEKFYIAKTAGIIDVGGGDSYFVDYLLESGYEDITVLDISEKAIERAKERIGDQAKKVSWIVADAATFQPEREYDFWHDRAAFHFLTQADEIDNYIHTVSHYLSREGLLVIGTFSDDGPTKCSGLEIQQYSEQSMVERLEKYFQKVICIKTDHPTPFGTIQKFTFCSFRKS